MDDDYLKLIKEASTFSSGNSDLELFKSQFIRSMQDSYVDESKIKEFRKILDTPTGELIAHMSLFASRKS